MSAGLWCDDLGLNALLLESEKEFGGQLLRTHNEIENHLGTTAKNGTELRDLFLKQIEKRKFLKHLQTEVKRIDTKKKAVLLNNGESFSAKFLIIATGVRRRKLNIEGESKFENKGILRSGKLQKDSVKNKKVIIVGGGDAALENVLILSETASKIYLVHRSREFRARSEFIEQVRENSKVEILFDSVLTKISGENFVENIEIKDLKTDISRKISAEAVLIRVGVQPNTDFLQGKIVLDKNGYIKTNELCETSVKNVFAIGDVANPVSPTISTAVGMGATAVKAVSSRFDK